MGEEGQTQNFNSPRGWRLLRAVLVWAAVALAYGFLFSTAHQPSLQDRLNTWLLGAGFWGLFTLPFWLNRQVYVVVGSDWIWGRRWLAIAFRGRGKRHAVSPGEALLRRPNGHIVLKATTGTLLRLSVPSADWARLSAAGQRIGLSVVDQRRDWESANPVLQRREWLLRVAFLGFVGVGILILGLTWDAPAFVVGMVAVGAGALCRMWSQNLPGMTPDAGGSPLAKKLPLPRA
jgi:hypothetical protein